MKKSGVIFDMDGLMFDTQCIYDKAFHDVALQDFGLKIPDGLRLVPLDYEHICAQSTTCSISHVLYQPCALSGKHAQKRLEKLCDHSRHFY